MAWEENSRICLHMQLIAILSRIGVGVYANDLFKTDKERWTMYGNRNVMTKDCYGYTRCVGMTLSYNFNTAKSKYKGTGAGNTEKNRL